MKRTDLEHLLRAAGRVIGADRIIVVGSQAILATVPEFMLPPEATMSVEADLIPLDGTEALADQIDGAIGEASMFHETFGVYAQGVGYETVTAPEGWRADSSPTPTTTPAASPASAWRSTISGSPNSPPADPRTSSSAEHLFARKAGHARHRSRAGTDDRPESRPDRTFGASRAPSRQRRSDLVNELHVGCATRSDR